MSFDNFLSEFQITDRLCDLIVEDFKQKKDLHNNSNDFREYVYLNDGDMNEGIMHDYVTKVHEFVTEYISMYPGLSSVIGPIKLHLPFNVQHYTPGKHYSRLHCENSGEFRFLRRAFVFMTYLNTIEEGGETVFPYQKLKVKPVKGKTIIWPAYWTHAHIGNPARSEDKYITTGWFEIKDFKS